MICVIDACSYIYLNSIGFTFGGGQKSLFHFLDKAATIRHSKIINEEIWRNYEDLIEGSLKRSSRYHKFKKSLAIYDQVLFDGSIDSSANGEDAGEKANFAVALDAYQNNRERIVYLSDDKKAFKLESVKRSLEAFPYFPTWNSFDVILFLYFSLNKKGFSFEVAKGALQDLIAFKFRIPRENILKRRGEMSNDEYSHKLNELSQQVQNIKIDFTKRLELIRNLINA